MSKKMEKVEKSVISSSNLQKVVNYLISLVFQEDLMSHWQGISLSNLWMGWITVTKQVLLIEISNLKIYCTMKITTLKLQILDLQLRLLGELVMDI